MHRLALAGVTAAACLAFAACGSSDGSTSAASSGTSASGATSPTTSSSTMTSSVPTSSSSTHATTTAAKWCAVYKSDPDLTPAATASQTAARFQKVLDQLKTMRYPENMPAAARSAVEDQLPTMQKLVDALKQFGSDTMSQIRSDPDKLAKLKKLMPDADAMDTPRSVSTWMTANCP